MSTADSYVQLLDMQAIPEFLVHLRNGQVSKQYAIQQYEAIAREHGKTIIPHIGEIMTNVLKVLSSDGPSSAPPQEACAKVITALARYTIDPSSSPRQREEVLRSLSAPLLDVLLGNLQSVGEGAAKCLHSLVETEAWRFAPQDIVNDVCLRVTGALEEKGTQTVAHMQLVGALIQHNGLILEAYGRSLLKAATQIVDSDVWQLRLHAVQMINTLLRTVDADILASEIPNAIMSLERCRSDRMPSIRKSATEILKFARALASVRSIEVPYDDGCSEVGSFYQDMASPDMNSYANSPVSSLRSIISRYPTPSVVGSDASDRRSYPFHASGGYYSDSIGEGSFSRRRDSSFSMISQISNSRTPSRDMISEQRPHSSLNHMGKDRGSRAYIVGRSPFFDKEGHRRRHSIGTGITFDTDADKVVESDQGVYQRRLSLEHAERFKDTGSSMLGQIGREVDRKDYLEWKHSYKKNGEGDNTSFLFHGNGCQTRCPSDVDKEETENLVKTGRLMKTDDPKASSTRRALVRFANHSTPSGTIRKRHPKAEYTEFADGYYDDYDVLHEGNSEGMAVVTNGRVLLERLESSADGYSDRSNSQEGSIHNSPVWSESVERSDSVSPTSSGTPFQDTPDNKEAYLITLSNEPDGRNHRLDEMMEGCQQAEDDYVEGSVDSFELEETSTIRRGWAKVSNFMESILGGFLCVVLAVPATMVAVKFLAIQEEYHFMAPT